MKRTGPDQKTAQLVCARLYGMCLRCQEKPGSQIHHRKPRGMGGTSDPKINDPENLVWICRECHALIERHREVSYQTGWLVRRSADPAEQYLIAPRRQMIMLLPDGGIETNDLSASDMGVPF